MHTYGVGVARVRPSQPKTDDAEMRRHMLPRERINVPQESARIRQVERQSSSWSRSDHSIDRALAVCFLSLVTTKCFYRCDDSRGKLVVDPCREALFCRNCRGLLWVLGCARAEDRVPRARNRYSGLSGIAGDPRTHKSSIILAPGHQ